MLYPLVKPQCDWVKFETLLHVFLTVWLTLVQLRCVTEQDPMEGVDFDEGRLVACGEC